MGYTPILRAEYFGHVDAFMLLYETGPNFSIIKVWNEKSYHDYLTYFYWMQFNLKLLLQTS